MSYKIGNVLGIHHLNTYPLYSDQIVWSLQINENSLLLGLEGSNSLIINVLTLDRQAEYKVRGIQQISFFSQGVLVVSDSEIIYLAKDSKQTLQRKYQGSRVEIWTSPSQAILEFTSDLVCVHDHTNFDPEQIWMIEQENITCVEVLPQ